MSSIARKRINYQAAEIWLMKVRQKGHWLFQAVMLQSKNVESAKVNREVHVNLDLSEPQSEEMNDELEIEKHMQSNGNRATACQTDGLLVFFGSEARSKNIESAGSHEIYAILHYQSLNLKMRENEFKSEEGKKELYLTNKENVEGNILQESCLKRCGQDDAEIMGVN